MGAKIETIDVQSAKEKRREKGLTMKRLAELAGYEDTRSLYRVMATGGGDKWAVLQIKKILFGFDRCPFCGARMNQDGGD